MKKNKNLGLIFLVVAILISSAAFLSNYKNFSLYFNQHLLMNSVLYGSYEFDEDYYEQISSGYPNLTATAIPIKSIMGAYWIQKDSIERGLKYLRKGNKENPYLGFSDMILANFHQAFGRQDSFTYYARQAIKKLPNAPAHYALISRVYVQENKIDSLALLFNEIKDKVIDPEVWRVYLSAMVTNKYKVDTLEVNKNARIAKNLFGSINSLELLSDYTLYGKDKVDKAIVLRKIAIDSFYTNPRLSLEAIEKANILVPDNQTNIETSIEMNYLIKDFKRVIEIYDIVNQNEIVTFQPQIIEYIAIAYLNLEEFEKGCSLVQLLLNNQVNVSASVIRACNR